MNDLTETALHIFRLALLWQAGKIDDDAFIEATKTTIRSCYPPQGPADEAVQPDGGDRP